MNIKRLLSFLVLPMLLFGSNAMAQERTVTGTVTDTAGNPIPNVSVVANGTKAGASTSSAGTFSLKIPASATMLTISSVGFMTQDVAIGEGSITVALKPSNAALSEVVVVGYGSQRKRDVTGSVSVVTAKDFQKGAISSPEQLIAGKVAGVSIISGGGQPGSGSQIRIRGGTSFVASNDPLIVIDGVPLPTATGLQGTVNPLSLVNPNDIESFTVLKDATSAAIYGSRAANGVIIITTKRGRGGPFRANFTTTTSVSTVGKKVQLLTGDEVRNIVNQSANATLKAQLGTANTDWQDVIYHTAISTDNNLSFTGGIKKLPYRVNLGYQLQNGILKTDRFSRTSLALNVSPSLLDNHLKIDVNLKGSIQKNRLANTGAIGAAASFDPTQPVYNTDKRYNGYFEWRDPNGSLLLNAARNPLGLLEQQHYNSTPMRSIGNIQLDYRLHFFPDLRANLNVGYDVSKNNGKYFVPDSAASEYLNGGRRYEEKQSNTNKLLEFYLNYVKDIPSIKSRVDVIAGYSFSNFQTKNYSHAELNIKGDTLSKNTNTIDIPEHTLISYFSRLIYSFDDKYLLTATLRRDGSSRFAKNNRWGVFPAVSVAWRLKNESFLKNNALISDLKLRGGYGETGQQEGIGNYEYIPFYYQGGFTETYYLGGDSIPRTYSPAGFNAALKWETTKSYNIALDYGFLNGRLSGTIEFYLKKTSDLLNRVPLPAGSTFGLYQNYNIGTLENKGVEFSISAQPVRTKSMTWDVNFNIAHNKNTVTKLSNDPNYKGLPTTNFEGGNGFLYLNTVGNPLNTFYLFKQVYDQNGKPIEGLFEDMNRDGQITADDRYKGQSADPNLIMGFSTNLSYKNWNFGFVLRAHFNNYVYSNVYSNRGRLNQVLGAYTVGNASDNYLETGFTGNASEFQVRSDYYLQNASFLRMDNFSAGYNFGKILRNKATLRANAFIQNVFVITKYKGIDPENSGGVDNTLYPRPRIYSLGLNLDF